MKSACGFVDQIESSKLNREWLAGWLHVLRNTRSLHGITVGLDYLYRNTYDLLVLLKYYNYYYDYKPVLAGYLGYTGCLGCFGLVHRLGAVGSGFLWQYIPLKFADFQFEN
jgi:hypothetical protein